MPVYTFTYTSKHVRLYTYILLCSYTYICMYVSIYPDTHVCVCLYACIPLQSYTYTPVRLYAFTPYIWTRMHIYIYMPVSTDITRATHIRTCTHASILVHMHTDIRRQIRIFLRVVWCLFEALRSSVFLLISWDDDDDDDDDFDDDDDDDDGNDEDDKSTYFACCTYYTYCIRFALPHQALKETPDVSSWHVFRDVACQAARGVVCRQFGPKCSGTLSSQQRPWRLSLGSSMQVVRPKVFRGAVFPTLPLNTYIAQIAIRVVVAYIRPRTVLGCPGTTWNHPSRERAGLLSTSFSRSWYLEPGTGPNSAPPLKLLGTTFPKCSGSSSFSDDSSWTLAVWSAFPNTLKIN